MHSIEKVSAHSPATAAAIASVLATPAGITTVPPAGITGITTVPITFFPTPDNPFEFSCLRCPKRWNRRDPLSTHRPECCPRCKSPSWDKPKQRRAKQSACAVFTDDDWARMAGSIIDTVQLTAEDDVSAKLIDQLKRYFGGNLSTC
jgi:hypothetical protein